MMGVVDFRYEAFDTANQKQAGVIAARDRDGALAALSRQGLTVVSLAPRAGGLRSEFSPAGLRLRKGKSSSRDLETLTTDCASLLGAGLTIDGAVALVADIHAGRSSGRLAAEVAAELRSGAALHEALARRVEGLAPSVATTIAAAERAGSLPQTLARLAERIQAERKFKSELSAALIYPALVACVAIAVVALLFGLVVPSIEEVVGERAGNLPTSARLVFEASRAWRSHGFEALTVGSGAILMGVVCSRHPRLKPALDRMRLRVPVVGSVLLEGDAARYARSLAALLNGGVPAAQAVALAAGTVELSPLRSGAAAVAREVTEGARLSVAIARSLPGMRDLPPLVRVGEESGRVALMLDHAADLYEHRARRTLKAVAALALPGTTVVLGLLVGAIVLAVMSAIVGTNEAIAP